MKIVYIPPHLYSALKKAGLRSQDYGCVDLLLNTLSPDDVAFYFFANRASTCPIPKPVAETFENIAANPGVQEDSALVRSVLTKYRSLVTNGSNAAMYEDNSVLTSDCEEEDLLILTHTAATDAGVGENSTGNDTSLYDRIVQQLLVFQPLERVLATPLVAGWMKSVQAGA